MLPEPARSVISRNKSPDIGFSQSINPYRGCEHGCVYCCRAIRPILMANGTTKPIAELKVGDAIYGTRTSRLVSPLREDAGARALERHQAAYRVIAGRWNDTGRGPDHRFLTERGWKFVTGTEAGRGVAPHLTINNKLMGTGAFAASVEKKLDYRHGYLCGVIRGDGLLSTPYHYEREGRTHGDQHQFRLALCDVEALDADSRTICSSWRVETSQFVFAAARVGRQHMNAIRRIARSNVERSRKIHRLA